MPENDEKAVLLAADIGGTKTDVGLFLAGKKRPRLKAVESYPSRDAAGIKDILEHFVGSHAVSPDGVCLGIAGPVLNGRCRTTNLPWSVSEAAIARRFGWKRVRLINDLTAIALSVPLLSGRQTLTLNRVRSVKEGHIGIVAPGTGLGQAILVFQKDRYVPVPSEGGHVDFAPTTEDEVLLWRYLSRRYGHVSVERVLSGAGLFDIYNWLKETHEEPPWLAEKIKSGDPARVISETAIEQQFPSCLQSVFMFVSILGAVCGNLALTAMTTGGIYLGGGIPPKILPLIREGPFMKSFVNKGRFRGLLEKMPVKVILDTRSGLLGAASVAQQMIMDSEKVLPPSGPTSIPAGQLASGMRRTFGGSLHNV